MPSGSQLCSLTFKLPVTWVCLPLHHLALHGPDVHPFIKRLRSPKVLSEEMNGGVGGLSLLKPCPPMSPVWDTVPFPAGLSVTEDLIAPWLDTSEL